MPDATPAIVPEDLFEAAQRRLQDPERRRAAKRKYDYGLTGIVRCGCGSAMVGQTTSGKYRYYRCRRAFAGPRHDRCPTRYVRADDLEDAVVRELTTVLSHPELVLAELEHASSAGAIEHGEVERLRERLAALEKQHQRLLRLYQLGEVDDAYLQREAAAIRAQRVRVEASLGRTNGADRPRIRLPQSPEEFAATCALLRERLLAEVDEGRLEQVAQAFQLSAELTSTEEGVSGALEGVIPHRFGENISHHCTNIGMSAPL